GGNTEECTFFNNIAGDITIILDGLKDVKEEYNDLQEKAKLLGKLWKRSCSNTPEIQGDLSLLIQKLNDTAGLLKEIDNEGDILTVFGILSEGTIKQGFRNRNGLVVTTPYGCLNRGFKKVVICGMTDIIYPGRELSDPIISDRDKNSLSSLSLPTGFDNYRYKSNIFESLLEQIPVFGLTMPTHNMENGKPNLPSPFLIRAFLKKDKDYPSPEKMLKKIKRNRVAYKRAFPLFSQDGGFINKEIKILLKQRENLNREILNKSSLGSYAGDIVFLKKAQKRLGQILKDPISPTSIEKFARCPYRYMIENFFQLKVPEDEEEIYPLDTFKWGNLFHHIAFKVIQDLNKNKLLPLQKCKEKFMKLTGEVTEEYLSKAKDECKEDDLNRFQTDSQAFTRVVEKWMEYELNGEPVIFSLTEWEFGVKKPFLFSLHGKEAILVRGKIDRIDFLPDQTIRIVDYKTFGNRKKYRNLNMGRTLQMPFYLQAAKHLLRKEHNKSPVYRFLDLREVKDIECEYDHNNARKIITNILVQIKSLRFPRGGREKIKEGQEEESCHKYCPVSAYCGSKKVRKKWRDIKEPALNKDFLWIF
ncbi:MAG: PD-(D/E)XK nuclease family protein, partial [Thermodesulfobacteriota bacterium]|nr:PD-(D/E)XK nuclease family protein [Thermodesulfobacteriota bacterium]